MGPLGELELRIPEVMAKTRTPGVSFAVVQRGRLVWRRGFGTADVESGRLVDADTVFEAGSMSKPVFAYAVMQLCARGAMDLDTPLTKYTPDRVLTGDSRLESVTARHVLSHTSGFQNWRSQGKPLSIAFTPGSKHMYSGEGYWYLQSVVSRLKGRTDAGQCGRYEGDVEVCATDIDEYLRSNVLRPLGMKSSGYEWNEKWRARAARGHDAEGRA
ncbi:MAG TPA: serine hydrolase domain-containing protein, partial [Bryobacteraceae bacterium]|nr:serine hydrolase domain-containing protein [Bryobacteraceae bacterium]